MEPRAHGSAASMSGAAATLSDSFTPRLRARDNSHTQLGGVDDDDQKKRRTGASRPLPFRAVLLAGWLALCAYALARILPQLSETHKQLLYLYYQPLVPLFFTLGLWGVNLAVWARMKLQPSPLALFGADDTRVHLTHPEVFRIAIAGFFVIISSSAVLVTAIAAGNVSLAAAQPVLLYVSLPVLLLLPLDVLCLRPRRFFLSTLWRMLAPLQPISFADFLLADFLTSLAKSVSDVERAVCSMVTGPVLAAAADAAAEFRCGSASWHIPMALALPYLIRLSQCVRQYLDNPEDRLPLANALKYFSALPVIALSALKYHVPLSRWTSAYRPLWLLSSFANSGMSFCWDVAVDWDLPVLTACCGGLGRSGAAAMGGLLLRADLLYGRPALYYFAILTNACLRISWTYKLSSHLRHNQRTVFVVTLLEALRRFQWTFFRLEVAYLKRFGLTGGGSTGAVGAGKGERLSSTGSGIDDAGKGAPDRQGSPQSQVALVAVEAAAEMSARQAAELFQQQQLRRGSANPALSAAAGGGHRQLMVRMGDAERAN